METCKLCLEDKPLIKKSHIIPLFMYNGMFENNEPINIQPLSAKRDVQPWEIKKSQEGEYEGGLLCAECDNKLLGHYYEDYASKIYNGGKSITIEKGVSGDGGAIVWRVSDVDYTKFKLFLLSILWRAGISKRDFFSEVNLKEEHIEKIRKMIISKNGGLVSEYPIFICRLQDDFPLPKGIIGQPRAIESSEELNIYTFIINGYFYWFYVNSNTSALPSFVTAETIKPSNQFNLIFLPNDYALNLIQAHALGEIIHDYTKK